MAIDFPNSPSVGDTHSDGGAVWKWSGYAWRRVPDPGAKGEPGDKGQKGEIGLTGNQGDKGEKGAPSTVAGAKGQKGEDGEKGSTGADGDKGIKGEPSTVAGDKGDKGDKGGVGAGTKGEKGAGSSVTIGVSPPTSPTPAPGDMWWDSDDADLHVYYNDGNSAQWVSVTSSAALKGQTGDKGQKGEKGEIGEKGQKGQTGDKGTKGDLGPSGGTGGTGPQGIKGQKGEAGAVADKGQKGEIGSTGGTGGTGSPGDKGEKGAPGSAGSTGIPSGFIGLWSGAANAIPSGWYLCDGNNGTPNLKGRFVVGYDNNDSDYDVNDTGGSKTITLSTSQLPSHNHSDGSLSTNTATLTGSISRISESFGGFGGSASGVFSKVGGLNTGGTPGNPDSNNCGGVNFNGNHSHDVTGSTGSTGSGSSIENRPPYYALCYIMKA